MSKCIDQHTPYLKKNYEFEMEHGYSEKSAEMLAVLYEYENLFAKLNFFKESIGIKLTAQDQIIPSINFDKKSLYNKEQLAIVSFMFSHKKFDILKPYTDTLLNKDSSFADKKLALKGISDQLLASATAERVGGELGKELSEVIEGLGYEVPIESEGLKQLVGQTEVQNGVLTPQQELEKLKENLATQTSPTVIKLLKATIANLESKLKEEKPQEEMSEFEKLKALVKQNDDEVKISAIINNHIFGGSSFDIDFDKDEINGYFEDDGKDYADSFYDSFSDKVYTKRSVNINGINYYFVKHNNLRKFVTFDEKMRVYKTSDLSLEVRNSNEFKYIENCN